MSDKTPKQVIKKQLLKLLRPFKFYRSLARVPAGEIGFEQLGTDAEVLLYKDFEPIKRKLPETPDTALLQNFENLLDETPPVVFVVKADDWYVWGNQGAVITKDGYLFGDVSKEFDKPDHSIFKQFKLIKPTLLKGTTAVIAASGSAMYYHWMFDVLPRIKLLADCNLTDTIDQYILYYNGIAFQNEGLAAVGIDVSKIIAPLGHWGFHKKAEHLVVPSFPSKLNTVSAFACNFLIDTFLNKQAGSNYGKRIYLKRKGKREIVNGGEIEDYLGGLGFEAVLCENYTIAEQAAIFYNADIVIGPHGAAFTNVVFCRPGTKVIEFFAPAWVNPCYWTICNEVALKYYYLVGENGVAGANAGTDSIEHNIQLNLDKLQRFIKKYDILSKGIERTKEKAG